MGHRRDDRMPHGRGIVRIGRAAPGNNRAGRAFGRRAGVVVAKELREDLAPPRGDGIQLTVSRGQARTSDPAILRL